MSGKKTTHKKNKKLSKLQDKRAWGKYNLFYMARTKVLLGTADDETRKMSIRETRSRDITCSGLSFILMPGKGF